jgi:hypothetical protein
LRLAALALGLIVMVAASIAVTVPATAAAPARCPTAKLVIWLGVPGGAAAGSTFDTIEFTNLSGRACSLGGYPGVSAVSLAGRQLGKAASRDRTHRGRLITLAPGSTASAVLQVEQALNYPRATCRPTHAAGLRVYPPGSTASKVVPFAFLACTRPGPVYLIIQPVRS